MSPRISRRHFLSTAAASSLAAPFSVRAFARNAWQGQTRPQGPVADAVTARAEFFPLSAVRLRPSPFYTEMQRNRAFLMSLPNDRLAHAFRLTAGLPSNAQPYGGWETTAPGRIGELRGHFTGGHYLSAMALLYASTGDDDVKAKADGLVAMLGECLAKNGTGYLSAFPEEEFDRLRDGIPVWAPYYTLHKIMAGLLDMHTQAGSQQALEMATTMAGWVSRWVSPLSDLRMQRILQEEYGGMGEVLYNLYGVTGNRSYLNLGHRFDKTVFFDPLLAQRDELKGLHVNTHIPQVIGAARAYELTADPRSHTIASYFWSDVVANRTYCTGGTSNGEHWTEDPAHLTLSTSTEECCCGYNMLKLTRHLFRWSADPRLMDYYERTLYNSRLGTQDADGNMMYYLALNPGGYKTFGTHDNSFWCCYGTGVEERAKFVDSIYAYNQHGVIVNLFIPSDLTWRERGFALSQETSFPDAATTRLTIHSAGNEATDLYLRIPAWAGADGSVKINGQTQPDFAAPDGYLRLRRAWRAGDVVELSLPMSLHTESLPGTPDQQAALYGPIVLAARLGSDGLTPATINGPLGPRRGSTPTPAPTWTSGGDLAELLEPADGPLKFQSKEPAEGANAPAEFAPLNQLQQERYAVYCQINRPPRRFGA